VGAYNLLRTVQLVNNTAAILAREKSTYRFGIVYNVTVEYFEGNLTVSIDGIRYSYTLPIPGVEFKGIGIYIDM